MSAITTLSATDVRRVLAERDLTDPHDGHHAIQDLVDMILDAVTDPSTSSRLRRANAVVPVSDNYDRLGYAPDAVARDARYNRYLTADLMLRSHTSAMLPLALEEAARDRVGDLTILCPGMVYRRDVIDRQHVGEPHQLDVWRVRSRTRHRLTEDDLDQLIDTIVTTALPGRGWRAVPAEHPYTLAGRQVDVADGGRWVEIGECGLAHPEVLARSGLRESTGLASGWGLDRLLMLRKGIDDIRLLRSEDPRIEGQMHDLAPYEPVSMMPPVTRDLSVAMNEVPDAELLGDRVRAALGEAASDVESVTVVATTPGHGLPLEARERLGMRIDQHNVLVRVVLRALDRTLTTEEANRLRDRIYADIHHGTVFHWAGGYDDAT